MMKHSFFLKTAGLMIIAGALAACTEQSMARRDTVSSFSPNTQATNIAVQAVNPWPHHVYRRSQEFSGERSAEAYERYRTGDVASEAESGSASVENSNTAPTSGTEAE